MVANIHFERRWFITNGANPPGHPLADEPIDGTYYLSEEEAKIARQNMIDCFGGLFPPERLVIAYEESQQREFFLGES